MWTVQEVALQAIRAKRTHAVQHLGGEFRFKEASDVILPALHRVREFGHVQIQIVNIFNFCTSAYMV
jgi:hypothetical protein